MDGGNWLKTRRIPRGEPTAAPWRMRVVLLAAAKFRQNVGRFRLYRHRFLQLNTRFAVFFKIYQITKLKFLKFGKICKFCDIWKFFAEFSQKLLIFQTDFLLKFWDCSGAKGCKSCRAWKMLSNAYFLAKFRFDTAENEPAKNLQNFVNFPNFANVQAHVTTQVVTMYLEAFVLPQCRGLTGQPAGRGESGLATTRMRSKPFGIWITR